MSFNKKSGNLKFYDDEDHSINKKAPIHCHLCESPIVEEPSALLFSCNHIFHRVCHK